MPSLAIGLSLRGRANSAVFSPASLFAASEPGVWYDPSDLTTLFTDSAGTIPVTAPNQTVGLMLDKSQGLVLGSELVTNGDFSGGSTGWSDISGAWAVTGGVLQGTSVGASAYGPYSNGTGVVAGLFYSATFTLTVASGGLFARVGNEQSAAYTSSGTYTRIFQAVTTGVTVFQVRATGAGFTGSIDNISVKLLAGNHATQATTASRPTYGVNPIVGTRNLLLATDTMATQSRTVTAVAHTLSFTGTGTIVLTGASIAGPLIGTGAGNRVSLTFTPTAASLTMTVTGSVTFAQLELGSTATAYQKVVTQYEVTQAGVASVSYLAFDGVDDNLVIPSLSLTGTEQLFFCFGAQRLSTTSNTALMTFGKGGDTTTYPGFALTVRGSSSPTYTPQLQTSSTTLNNNFLGVANLFGNVATRVVSATRTTLRVNANGIGTTGSTGNFDGWGTQNNRLGCGYNSANNNFWKGNIYPAIFVASAVTTGQITSTESWVNGKTGAY